MKNNCENWQDYLTVGQLKKDIKDLPDNTPVFYQRIEDVYFKKYGWSKNSIFIPDDFEKDVKELDSEYVRAFCAFRGKKREGKRILLFITAHY